jgi:hypothetical protein
MDASKQNKDEVIIYSPQFDYAEKGSASSGRLTRATGRP